MTIKIIYYFFSYFMVSAVLALILVPLMRLLSFRVGALDLGTGRRVHTGIVPRLGGIGIFIAFVIPMVFSLTRGEWDVFHDKMSGILIASLIIILIGAYDDIKGAGISLKLLAEVLAASVIYAWGIRITQITNPFGGQIILGWMSLPVTVLWIIVITNAINLIDGLDGLAAGTGILISATLFLLSGTEMHLQLTYAVLAGSLLGFLRYNFPPASVFMGDSGSLFLGFFLGSTSILASHKATAIATIMVPIIAFSFPLMDMVYAVLRRYYRGVYLGEPDREHIHHKLLEKGLSKRRVLMLLYFINISIMLIVLILVRQQFNVDFLGLALLAVAAVAGLRMLGYIKFMSFIRELARNHDIGRKRKYYNYVIKRFRQAASGSRSLEDLSSHLTMLMKEYGFSSVEIRLSPGKTENPFYHFSDGSDGGNSMSLSFPIIAGGNTCIGNVYIRKEMNEDHFLCVDEMTSALSEEISRFVTTTTMDGRQEGDPDKAR